jgi:anthranilate/para-aminobenzoate synthase component II
MRRLFEVIIILLALVFIAVLVGGCQDSVGLRFSPTEEIKQNAELTSLLAQKINVDGTDPESPASEKLVVGTATSLAYTGRPTISPNPDDFDTINEQAQADAELRPDIEKTIDSALGIGLGIATLLGGAGGVKLAQGLRIIHGKAKAFNEVVSQNELFKKLTSAEGRGHFKQACVGQTASTQKAVAQCRAEEKTKMVRVPKGTVQ